MTKQLDSLQALRAVAALMVVLFHLGVALTADYKVLDFSPFPAGSSGVDIFFVLSGFIMCYTTEGAGQRSAVGFAVKRLVRIVPLYWVLTLLLFGVAVAAPSLLSSTEASPEALWKSLAFIPYVSPADGKMHPLLMLGWTLNYEMFFYAVFTLCLVFIPSRRITTVVVILLALRAAGAIMNPSDPLLRFYTGQAYQTQLEFVWGCLLFVVYRYRPQWVRAAAPFGIVGAVALLAQNWWPNLAIPRDFKAGLPATLIVLGALGLDLRAGAARNFAVSLGDASYSLYLGHPYVMDAVTRIAIIVLGANVLGAVAGSIVTLVAAAALSLLSYRLFERPTNDWLRRKFLGDRRRIAASAAVGST